MKPSHPAGELYFIALVPPEPVFSEALAVKQEMAEKYGTKAALNSPPHITLHMPFRMKEAKEELLTGKLKEVVEGVESFEIHLDGYGAFEPRVIYIDVKKTESLSGLYHKVRKTMQRFLHMDNADWKNRGFHPHLTVAFRDLKKPLFKAAWNEFRDKVFSGSWKAGQVMLLKHNGSNWEIYREFPLSKGK